MLKKSNYLLIGMLVFVLTAPAASSLQYEIVAPIIYDNIQSTNRLDWNETQKLLASDGAIGDTFGHFVSLSGDTAVIGAHADDGTSADSGSAYVFVRTGTTWSQQAKLLASDSASFDYFGWSGAVDGNTTIIGVIGDDDYGTESGSAYVFVRQGTTWTQQAKLHASDGAAGDGFGYSVSLSGDTAVIGAPYDADAGSFTGSAYVFVRSGAAWTQQAKILPAGAATQDYIGDSVFIVGDTALIGAPYDNDNGDGSGSAYVFTRTGTTWSQQAKLLASDGAAWDNFGCSLSLSGETALIGAEGTNDNGFDSGSTYVFIRSGTTWTQQAKLLASDGEMYDFFGGSTSLSGDIALIGAAFEDDNADSAGAVYEFARIGTTWTQQTKLLASDGADSDWFGGSVCLEGVTAFIGAYGDDDKGAESGSVYVFIGEDTNQPPHANFTWTPQNPYPNQQVLFNASTSSDPDGIITLYEWDWDNDGSYEEDATSPTATHTWVSGGAYLVTLRVTDDEGATATHSDTILVQNQPANPPPINGTHCGKVNTEYTFTIGPMTNPDGDEVFYLLDWGDGTVSEWIGPFPSDLMISMTHTWSEPGIYHLRVKAKDAFGAETNWSEVFTIYITSQVILIGFAREVVNQTEEYTILDMSFALLITLKPFDLKMYSSQQILVLDDEFKGILAARFIAGLIYALVLTEEVP